MICEREDEIAAFVPREYWTIDAELEHTEQKFPAKLVEYRASRSEQFSFTNEGARTKRCEPSVRPRAASSTVESVGPQAAAA